MTELRTNTGGFIAGTAQTVISVIQGRFVFHRIMQILIGVFCHAGVNFTNILQAAFSHADPKRKKDTFDLTLFLHFFGFALVKVACKHVDEIDPYEKFPNNL